jgi:hypothetical protein
VFAKHSWPAGPVISLTFHRMSETGMLRHGSESSVDACPTPYFVPAGQLAAIHLPLPK